jgi:hypothetical protein
MERRDINRDGLKFEYCSGFENFDAVGPWPVLPSGASDRWMTVPIAVLAAFLPLNALTKVSVPSYRSYSISGKKVAPNSK